MIIAVLFTPLQRRLVSRFGRSPTAATLLTLLVIVFIVLPLLLPAVGAALTWVLVAVHLLVIGSLLQGVVLVVAYGVLVIGLVDNVLRPILVGKDTRMPDNVVLISTLGGAG